MAAKNRHQFELEQIKAAATSPEKNTTAEETKKQNETTENANKTADLANAAADVAAKVGIEALGNQNPADSKDSAEKENKDPVPSPKPSGKEKNDLHAAAEGTPREDVKQNLSLVGDYKKTGEGVNQAITDAMPRAGEALQSGLSKLSDTVKSGASNVMEKLKTVSGLGNSAEPKIPGAGKGNDNTPEPPTPSMGA